VIDAPGGGGKIPLLPDYVVGRDGDDLLLRNFEGGVYRYPDPGGTIGAARRTLRAGRGPQMRVGLTYDLRDDYRALGGFSEDALAEFDSPETIDALEHALRANGCRVERIGHIRSLARRLVDGENWDLVFNIAEGVAGRNREAQVPALLEAYNIPYVFSDPLTLSVDPRQGGRQAPGA
jgi:hypothetical protein